MICLGLVWVLLNELSNSVVTKLRVELELEKTRRYWSAVLNSALVKLLLCDLPFVLGASLIYPIVWWKAYAIGLILFVGRTGLFTGRYACNQPLRFGSSFAIGATYFVAVFLPLSAGLERTLGN